MQQTTGARSAWKWDIGPMTVLGPGSKYYFQRFVAFLSIFSCYQFIQGHHRQYRGSFTFSETLLVCRYVQRDSRTTVMKRKTETVKEDAKKAKKDDSSSGNFIFVT